MTGSFPKIMALGTKYVSSIFDEPVEITEKVDGSQFGFGMIDNELFCRSKGTEIDIEAALAGGHMFQRAVQHAHCVKASIPPNLMLYCEFLQKPKHNMLAYDHVPRNNLVLFAAMNVVTKEMAGHETLTSLADLLDMDIIPLLFYGMTDAKRVMGMLDRISFLGGQKIEGVVVKNHKDIMLGDQVFPIMSAKYVSDEFKEVHKRDWVKTDKWQEFKDSYRTEARWAKAVQHLDEAGKLEYTPKDIGTLVAEINRDIGEEGHEDILAFLWTHFSKDLLKNAVRGAPEWYKEQLATGALGA